MNDIQALIVAASFGGLALIFGTMSDRRRTQPRRRSPFVPDWGSKSDYTSDGWRYRVMAFWCLILGIIALLVAWTRLT
jgi:hypothetical protein